MSCTKIVNNRTHNYVAAPTRAFFILYFLFSLFIYFVLFVIYYFFMTIAKSSELVAVGSIFPTTPPLRPVIHSVIPKVRTIHMSHYRLSPSCHPLPSLFSVIPQRISWLQRLEDNDFQRVIYLRSIKMGALLDNQMMCGMLHVLTFILLEDILSSLFCASLLAIEHR